MRALQLVSDRKLEIADVAPPPPPGEGEVQIKTHAIALNHIDVWGWRGMAFAKRDQVRRVIGVAPIIERDTEVHQRIAERTVLVARSTGGVAPRAERSDRCP
jgi:NADPH:quinone reductase-like Zn-dependent oxidoreductase